MHEQQKPGGVRLFPSRPTTPAPQAVPPIPNLEGLVRKALPADVHPEDLQLCLELARQYNLNPVTGEINFLPSTVYDRGRPITRIKPVVSRDGLLSLAHRSGDFDSIEQEIEVKAWPTLQHQVGDDGRAVSVFVPIDQPVVTSRVYRKSSSRPFVVTVAFWEYAVDGYGNLLPFWKEKPVMMTGKVADSQALRKAFQFAGLYIPEELKLGTADESGVALAQPAPPRKPSPTQPEQAAPVITPPQAQATARPAPSVKEEFPTPGPRQHYQALVQSLTEAGIADRTKDWEAVWKKKIALTEDSFFGSMRGNQVTFYAWLRPDSPNQVVLDELGFTEDLSTTWWSLTIEP